MAKRTITLMLVVALSGFTFAQTPTVPKDRPAPPAKEAKRPGEPNVIVWINTDPKSGHYFCAGTRWFGKTKQGKSVTQASAKQAGYTAAGGNECHK